MLTDLWTLQWLLRHHTHTLTTTTPNPAAGGTPPKLHSHWAIFWLPMAWRAKAQSSPGHVKGSECQKNRLGFQHPLQVEHCSRTSPATHFSIPSNSTPCAALPPPSNPRPLATRNKTRQKLQLPSSASTGLPPEQTRPKARTGAVNTLRGRRAALK